MKIEKELFVNINKLYPTESLAFISPERINELREMILPDGSNTEIFVIEFDGYYYIVKGHHQFLAAANLGLKNVRIYLVDYHDLSVFSNPNNIEKVLSSVGMTAIYDFEGIGGFTYESYPKYYI